MTETVTEPYERARREIARLSRNLDITNADHIALWIEANTIPDEPMSQCASWLACRIVEAHEAALSRASQPVEPTLDSEAVERVAAVIAPHLRVSVGCNPDCDDQNAAHDNAVRIARAALLDLAKPVGGERCPNCGGPAPDSGGPCSFECEHGYLGDRA